MTGRWLLSVPVVVLTLAGCNENVSDREEGAGMAADGYADVTNVVVWRNADRVPNLATFCADGRAWVATLNSEHGGRGQLLRDSESDRRCQS